MNTDNSPQKAVSSIGPVGLTIGLILLTVIPFLFVVTLYVTLPTNPDPELPVQVSVGPRIWTSDDSSQNRLLPSLILTNPTDEIWNNLNMSINGQYYYYHPEKMHAGEELVIPLKFFHTKGNQFFSLENQPIQKLMVFAQIPSGARAIKQFSGEDLQAQESDPSQGKLTGRSTGSTDLD